MCFDRVQIAREKLVGLGTCIGKFTHSGRFRLTVGSLDILAKYAKYKVSRPPIYMCICAHSVCCDIVGYCIKSAWVWGTGGIGRARSEPFGRGLLAVLLVV